MNPTVRSLLITAALTAIAWVIHPGLAFVVGVLGLAGAAAGDRARYWR